ncbi:hypothetical protein MRX96_011619 [Rhipicephalus microplus]
MSLYLDTVAPDAARSPETSLVRFLSSLVRGGEVDNSIAATPRALEMVPNTHARIDLHGTEGIAPELGLRTALQRNCRRKEEMATRDITGYAGASKLASRASLMAEKTYALAEVLTHLRSGRFSGFQNFEPQLNLLTAGAISER